MDKGTDVHFSVIVRDKDFKFPKGFSRQTSLNLKSFRFTERKVFCFFFKKSKYEHEVFLVGKHQPKT